MKKYFTLFVIIMSTASQPLKAQLDMVFVSNFSNTSNNSANRLTWTIAKNHGIISFDVERSTNGKDFRTVAVLKATEKYNTESYTHTDTITSPDIIMYRLKILSKTQHVFFSKIVLVKSKITLNHTIKVIENPVRERLSFNYDSKNERQADMKIYALTGKVVFSQTISGFTGNNLITIPLSAGLAPGMYIIEMNNGIVSETAKFIKQ